MIKFRRMGDYPRLQVNLKKRLWRVYNVFCYWIRYLLLLRASFRFSWEMSISQKYPFMSIPLFWMWVLVLQKDHVMECTNSPNHFWSFGWIRKLCFFLCMICSCMIRTFLRCTFIQNREMCLRFFWSLRKLVLYALWIAARILLKSMLLVWFQL